MAALHRGYYVAAALSTIGLAVACRRLLYCDYAPQAWLCFFAAGMAGVIAALMILYITSYYTEAAYRPTRSICEASRASAPRPTSSRAFRSASNAWRCRR